MNRKQFTTGDFVHVFNRGVDKRDIFINDYDRWRFLLGLFAFNDENSTFNALWQANRIYGKTTFNTVRKFLKDKERNPIVRILAYCLTPNHFHLLLEEIKPGGISKFMQKFGTAYSMYFNKKYERSGALFEGPFKSVVSESQEQLEYLLFYINIINPAQILEPDLKENGLRNFSEAVNFANKYNWCTNKEFLKERESIIIEKGVLGEIFDDTKKYKEYAKMILAGKTRINNENLLLD